MIQAIEGLARSHGAPAVATVGRIRAEPDQVNVIPGRAMFTVDVRHADYGARRGLEERVRSICETIAGERKLRLEIRVLQEKAPVAMHADLREVLWQAIADSGSKALDLVSGAGHDAQILAARCKVGMLFVPSIGGRSHCPEESTSPAHLELGTKVLGKALELLAY